MRYKESREQSAELLRMVLPLMARHSAGFHPLSYSVWYEYVSGCNPGLRSAVDARLAQNSLLNERDIEALFDAHVAMRDVDSSARMRNEIARLVKHVEGVAVEAGQEVHHYGEELDGYRERLMDDSGKESIVEVVESLIDETMRVRVKTEIYHDHLKKSSDEVERLRGELEMVQGLAQTDPLTGLLNRRGFEQQRQRLCGVSAAGFTLLVIDIDHFKAINDAHGPCWAIGSSSRSPMCCEAVSVSVDRSRAWAARNSRCCCRTPRAPAGSSWLSASAARSSMARFAAPIPRKPSVT